MLTTALRWALRNGVRKGVVEGRGPWLVVAVVAGLWQLARRPAKSQAVRFELHPGERYSIICDEPVAR
ncbi:MAG: hypothetical protein QOK28_1030 [Actinomycetota bacterium]|jgi:hypothetical protein